MSDGVPLRPGGDAFPSHAWDVLGVDPVVFEERIGGSVLLLEKRPEGGPLTIMTSGVSRLPTASGDRVELAVEVIDGQEGAAIVALRIVCDDIATRRRVPPLGTPWRNDEPFLVGTAISAIVATPSRWGSAFDDVLDDDGTAVGHVRTLRLLTDREAAAVSTEGWAAVRDRIGLDRLLDVERSDPEPAPAEGADRAGGPRRRPLFGRRRP